MDASDDTSSGDPDTVQLLVCEACRLMENASPELALALPAAGPRRTMKLTEMLAAVRAIQTLLDAAAAIDGLGR